MSLLMKISCAIASKTFTTSFKRLYTNMSIDPKPATMKFIRFSNGSDSGTKIGLISDDGNEVIALDHALPNDMIELIKNDISPVKVREAVKSGKWEKITDTTWIRPPIPNPQKIICIGLNYLGHCKEQNKEAPKEPMFFSKFATALTGPFDNVFAHKATSQIDWEVEMAVIIGKTAKNISKEDAFNYVFGYSVAQDISARDWQKTRNGGQFLIGKSMDTFCPMGPAIVHKSLVPDPHNLKITCHINGELKQNGSTSELIFRIDDIIHSLTQTITLNPGDIILTGTPAGVGMHRNPPEFLNVGDIIESEIELIGKMRNKVGDVPK